MAVDNRFLLRTEENADLNQYWYSAPTIKAIVDEVKDAGGRAAFVSTPSLYFSIPKAERAGHAVLDFDKQWESDPGYLFYDFNDPSAIPDDHHHVFDVVIVDPPFITREVWEKYAETMKLIGKEGTNEDGSPACKFICSTISENADMMKEIVDVVPQAFKPSIPHLVYQYNMYANFPTKHLCEPNPEIPED